MTFPSTLPLSFASPVLLWGLLLLPLAVAGYLMAQRRRARYAVRFTNLDLLANLIPHTPAWRRHLPTGLYLLSLGSLLVSLARPQAIVPVPKEHATVVMVMDTSGSMAASDVQPTRMAAARQAGKTFLDVLPPKFRVALVPFSTTAQVAVRPTTDRAAVREALDALRADGGTAMGDAIQRGLEVAQSVNGNPDVAANGGAGAVPTPRGGVGTGIPPRIPSPPTPAPTTPAVPTPPAAPGASTSGDGPPPAAILLLSDGASTSGRLQPLEAARAARQLGIPVYTIALGTQDGALEIPGPRNTVRRQPVPPDEETLRQVAEITGGHFFAAPTARDLRAVYQDIGSRIGYVQEPHEVTAAFAAAAAVFLLIGGALSLHWFHRFP